MLLRTLGGTVVVNVDGLFDGRRVLSLTCPVDFFDSKRQFPGSLSAVRTDAVIPTGEDIGYRVPNRVP